MGRQSLKQKRSQCANCPNVKRVVSVLYAGKRMDLCEPCRLVLSRILRERQDEVDRAKIKVAAPTPIEELEDEMMTEDIEAAIV